MAHESFEEPATASVMNERFVNVKVDREERPDLDAIYMDAVVTMTGSGGWPMTVFLTPAGEPFYGGTYYPPEPRHGLPSFRQVLVAIDEAWRTRREELDRAAAQLVESVRRSAQLTPSDEPLTAELLAEAERGIARTFEPSFGGFGRAPKFPPASTLELLLRVGGERATTMVERTLDGMAAGGMYDLVGGGFHRYSVDDRWLVPHFEKMLYDNALLVPAYLHAWQLHGRERWREVVEETCDYLLRELRLAGGGFASAQDADTDGVEGLTHTWTAEEGVPAELLEPFEHGRSIIRGTLEPELRARLLATREGRPQPGLDDKAIASWNGLAVAALAEAGRVLGRADWIEAAAAAAEFVLDSLSDADGRLLRSWREGTTSGTAYLDDYANVAHGLIELHLATGEVRWLARGAAARARGDGAVRRRRARRLLPRAEARGAARRADEGPGRPSAAVRESMLAHVLLRLARLWGDDELERRAVSVLRLVAPALARAPGAFAWALCALDLYLAPPRELAVVGAVEARVARAALGRFEPEDGGCASARRRTCRCSRARDWSPAAPPCTSASASPVRLPSRIAASCRCRCASV